METLAQTLMVFKYEGSVRLPAGIPTKKGGIDHFMNLKGGGGKNMQTEVITGMFRLHCTFILALAVQINSLEMLPVVFFCAYRMRRSPPHYTPPSPLHGCGRRPVVTALRLIIILEA